jgi:hypothetical protein
VNEIPFKRGRPKGGYFVDGKRVPSVTTITSKFKEAGGLMHWSWQCGIDGKDYRTEREEAASAGTLAHSMVEAWVRDEPPVCSHVDPEVAKRAQRSFDAFLEWANQSSLKVTHTELPLVSKKLLFGGTLDGITLNGRRAIVDWKTSNGIYEDMLVQIAAYKGLWEENFPDDPIEGGLHLVRFDKTYGDFAHRWWPELDAGWRAFTHMRPLYEDFKELKKRAA